MSAILYKKFEPGFIERVLLISEQEEQVNTLLKEINGEEEDDRIMCDYVIQFLNHLLECGTSYPHMANTINFAMEFMKNTSKSSLVNALRTLQQTLPNLSSINQYQRSCVLEYLNKTYFQHFNLYKYVLTQPRQQDYTHYNKDIYIPDQLPGLAGGVLEFQWRYDEKVRSITEQHAAALQEAERVTQTYPVERLNKRGRVHQEQVADLVTGYIKNQCNNIENDVLRSLKITEVTMVKELAIIEACIAKNKEKQLNPSNSSTSSNASSKKSPKSARGKKSPAKK